MAETKMSRWPIRLALHLLSTGAFLAALMVAHALHATLFGLPPSRGVSVGIALRWVVMAHLGINTVTALIPRLLFKGVGIVLFAVITLSLLLPQHPMRAAFAALVGSACSVLAVWLGRVLTRARAA